jgi:hypothetical protein
MQKQRKTGKGWRSRCGEVEGDGERGYLRPDAVVVGQPTLLLGWTQRLLGSRLSSLVVVEGKWGSPLQRCRWSSRGETHRDTQQSTGPCREMRASESVLVRSLIVVNRFTGDAARLLSVRWKPFKRPLSERWV